MDERFFPRPRANVDIIARSVDVLFARKNSDYGESVSYADWDVLCRFDGTQDLRSLARTWATDAIGADTLTARLEAYAVRYGAWFESGPALVLPAREMPPSRRVPRGAHRVGDTDIPTRPLAGAMTVTHVCNLRCTYCFQDHAVHSRPHPPRERLLHVVRAFGEAEVRRIRMTGGEPMSHPAFADVVRECARDGIQITGINSNGTLVSDDIVDALRAAQPGQVSVSLDGVDPTWLDALYASREAGARAMRGIERLGRAGIRVTINFTVVGGGVGHLDATLRWAEDAGVTGFSARGCKQQAHGIARTPTDAEDDAAMAIVQTWQSRSSTLAVRNYQPARPPDTSGPNRFCNALTTGAVMIDPSGDAVPCDYFVEEPEFALGNVHERKLSEIWGGERHVELWRAWYRRNADPMWRGDCKTNCPAVALRKRRGPLASLHRPERRGLPLYNE